MRSFLSAVGHAALDVAADVTVAVSRQVVTEEVQRYADRIGNALAHAQETGRPAHLVGSNRMDADVFVTPEGNFMVQDRRAPYGKVTFSADSVGVQYAQNSRGGERTTRDLTAGPNGLTLRSRERRGNRDRRQSLWLAEGGGLSYDRRTTRTGGGGQTDSYVRAETDGGDNRSLEAGYYDRESEDRYSRGEGSVRTSRHRAELAAEFEERRRRSYYLGSVRYAEYSDDER
jgi:hypothetical protein